MRTRRRQGLIVWFMLLSGPSLMWAQSDDDVEYEVKLAFLYHFAQFVIWPADAFRGPGAPLAICIAGPDPFRADTEKDLRSRRIRGHPVEIRRLEQAEDPRACQMVFIRASEKKRVRGVLTSLGKSSTLTVGEAEGFAQMGGMINLVPEAQTLRFEINLEAAARSRLQMSSRLLSLARIVKGIPGP